MHSRNDSCVHLSTVRRDKDLKRYIENAVEVDPERPVLVDKYLDRADELDVDALCDKDGNVVICGIMQHIEQAGVHSGEEVRGNPAGLQSSPGLVGGGRH